MYLLKGKSDSLELFLENQKLYFAICRSLPRDMDLLDPKEHFQGKFVCIHITFGESDVITYGWSLCAVGDSFECLL